jgi:hypothetical protein
MKGHVIFQKWISRSDLMDNPDKLYVFGDNNKRYGRGGQAKEMRGEPNAFGIPTKWAPMMSDDAYFSDEQYDIVAKIFDFHFKKLKSHIENGTSVVIPTDGLGTGLSQLPQRAPKINELLQNLISELKEFANEY